jgi:hypothetical protein
MRNTKTARTMVKKKGREGWMFFNPTIGTYQSRKMRKKRIKQVKTKSPMKILFLGLISKTILLSLIGCRGFGVISLEFGVFDQGFNAPNSELRTQNLLFQ